MAEKSGSVRDVATEVSETLNISTENQSGPAAQRPSDMLDLQPMRDAVRGIAILVHDITVKNFRIGEKDKRAGRENAAGGSRTKRDGPAGRP